MKTLTLIITRKWLWETLFNGKGEEYRNLSPHYKSRICACYSTVGCVNSGTNCSSCRMIYTDRIGKKHFPLRAFDAVKLRAGYHRTAATALIECKGIEIGIGNPRWGAQTGREVYIIKHGAVLETTNCETLRDEFSITDK